MIKILELFGGIGACSKAFERLGIEYEIADYVEIDKYAVKSFNAIHNTNFEPQDICNWNKDIEVDLIMHGSPCQDFSLAGKQAGGDKESGTRSSLMYETLRIVEQLKPKYVIWENVKNILSKKHIHNFNAYLESMEQLGYKNYYQVLNAKDYGIPQNRERVFTISILKGSKFEFPKTKINKNKINRLFNFSTRQDCRVVYDKNGLCPTLVAGMGCGGGKVPMFIENESFHFPPKQELKLRLKDLLENEVDEKYYLNNKQIENIKKSNFNKNSKKIQEKDYSDTLYTRDWKDKKCVNINNIIPKCLNSKEGRCGIEGLQPSIQNRIYDSEYISTSITTSYMPNFTSNEENFNIRKLTPKECWRLMGFDDEDFDKTKKVNSNTQLYKQAGNSIVVNVLEEILKILLGEK